MSAGAQDANEVFVGASGHIYVASAAAATPPTDATTPPGAEFVDIGYTTEDGFRWTDAKTVSGVPSWQSFYDLRKLISARDFTAAFNMLQFNQYTLPFALGGGTITGSSPDQHFSPPDPSVLDERAVIADLFDGSDVLRLWMPKCIVAENVESAFVRTEAATLPIGVSVVGQAGVAPYEFFIHNADFAVTGLPSA